MLKRYKPLIRKTPLKRSTKPINKKSPKKKLEDRIYSGLRIIFLRDNPVCQACLDGCAHNATEVHHKRGRGVWFLVVETWLAVCWRCHRWIEDHPDEAKELKLSEKRTIGYIPKAF